MADSYRLQRMSGERAKQVLSDLLVELSGIDPSDLTTFELKILHRVAENPPKQRRGKEELLTEARDDG